MNINLYDVKMSTSTLKSIWGKKFERMNKQMHYWSSIT